MSKVLPDQYEKGIRVRLLEDVTIGFYRGNIVTYHNSIERSTGEVWHNFINQIGDKCYLLEGEFETI